MLAPQTGSELRGMLRNYASRAKDDLVDRGRDAWDTAVERERMFWRPVAKPSKTPVARRVTMWRREEKPSESGMETGRGYEER